MGTGAALPTPLRAMMSTTACNRRPYSGTIGKVANGQVSVNCHYAERTSAWPAATRLYLPEDWCRDATRRTGSTFRTRCNSTPSPRCVGAALSGAGLGRAARLRDPRRRLLSGDNPSPPPERRHESEVRAEPRTAKPATGCILPTRNPAGRTRRSPTSD